MTDAVESLEKREKMLNIPPLTAGVFLILLLLHLARAFVPAFDRFAIDQMVLIPAQWTQEPWTLLSYSLLHFGWTHFGINTLGLLAFGSGVERFYGRLRSAAIYLGGVVAGALFHIALFAHSTDPLGGASAGISALFGAALIMLVSGRNLVIACLVFIISNLAFGMAGLPDQPEMSIAWQAHIGGFIIGLIIGFACTKKEVSVPLH